MSFVGIIADSDNYEFIKKGLLKDKTYSNLQLINLNKSNIENMKNIKFETIAICVDMQELKSQKIIVNSIIKDSKYLIINSDINCLTANFEDNRIQIITYGMNQKATVTASSINEDEVLVCLQRNIENIKSNIIEMQEFKMKAENITNEKVYNLLVLFIIEQLYK